MLCLHSEKPWISHSVTFSIQTDHCFAGEVKFPPTGPPGQQTEQMDSDGREEPLNLSNRTGEPAVALQPANGKIAGRSDAFSFFVVDEKEIGLCGSDRK